MSEQMTISKSIMKYLFMLFFALSATTISVAQPETAHWSGMNYLVGESYFTYGDQVTLRKSASTNSEKLKSIPINTKVQVLEVATESMQIYGLIHPWLKVTYDGNEGFIAAGFLALRSIKLGDGSDLLYTRSKEEGKNEELQVSFRKVRDRVYKELGTYSTPNSSFDVTLHDGKGLTGVNHVVQIDFLAEACGEEGGRSYLLLIEDDTINYLGLFSSVGDGGVYHASEDLTFPFDSGGRHDCIIFNGEEGEEDENGLYRTVSYTKVYGWSADGLSEPIVIPSYK
jgi:hypothetical protein